MSAIKRLSDWNGGDDLADTTYTPDSFEFQRDLIDVLRSHDALLTALRLAETVLVGATDGVDDYVCDALGQITDAIAKAEAV